MVFWVLKGGNGMDAEYDGIAGTEDAGFVNGHFGKSEKFVKVKSKIFILTVLLFLIAIIAAIYL
jgi:hypothetical protein